MKSNEPTVFEPVLMLVFSAGGQPVTVDLASSPAALTGMRAQNAHLPEGWKAAEVPMSLVLPDRACRPVVIVPSRSELAEAREWLADCGWPDVEAEEIGIMGDIEIVTAIQTHYEGGWAEFVKTTRPWSESNPSGFTVVA